MHNVYVTLNWYEYFLWLVYVTLGAGFLYFYKSYSENSNKYLIHGYFVKMFGGLFLALVYVYYYKLGDTTDYYLAAKDLSRVFYEKPKVYFDLLFSDVNEAREILFRNKLSLNYVQWSSEEFFMARLSSPFNILGFNSYLGMTYFFSLMSFFGTLKLSHVFNSILPKYERQNFMLAFLAPSVVIWGSGVLKDTFTLTGFNLLCYLLYQSINYKQSIFSFAIKLIIPAYIVFKLKAYILICFIPFVFVAYFVRFIKDSTHPVAKFMILPYLIGVISIGLYFSTSYLLDSSEEYKRSQILSTIEGFKSWHTELGGSAYDLGEMEFTEVGLLKKMPAAINVTLFRPYPWECKTVLSLFAGLESFFFLFFTIVILVRNGMKVISKMYETPFLFGALIYVLLLAFALGISAYNFGALVRFKIPLISVYLFLIYYSHVMVREGKLNSLVYKVKTGEVK